MPLFPPGGPSSVPGLTTTSTSSSPITARLGDKTFYIDQGKESTLLILAGAFVFLALVLKGRK